MINNIIYLNISKVCPICGERTKIIVSDSGVKNLICDNQQEPLGQNPYIGQKIWVIKSNQIIPQITRAEV